MREKIECGVQGEAFRRDRRASALHVQRLECGAGKGVALALPECCRVAVSTVGALPEGTEVLWRLTPSSGRPPESLERCVGGGLTARPYLLTAGSAADVRYLARSLPLGSTWGAHITGPRRSFFVSSSSTSPPPLPTFDDVAMLRDAGCGGIALGSVWRGEEKRVISAWAAAADLWTPEAAAAG